MAEVDHARPRWRKSSHSGAGTNCVELARRGAHRGAHVAVRDSKNPAGPALALTPAVFHRFIREVKAGKF